MTSSTLWMMMAISIMVMLPSSSQTAAQSLQQKVPPGSLSVFAPAMNRFDLQLPLVTQAKLVMVHTLGSNPSKDFTTGINYSKYFWSLSQGTPVMVFSCPAR